MSEPPMSVESLADRVKRLERRERLWRWIFIVLFVIVFAIPILRFAEEEGNLETRSFVLTDKQGRQRAVLGTSEDGSPSLVFYDSNGRIVAVLHTKSDGSTGLQLLDKDGHVLFHAP